MRGKEVLRAVLIGIAVTLLLAGIIAIIVYFSLSAGNKTMTFLATDAAPISLSKLSVNDFAALISGTSSVYGLPLVTASFSGKGIKTEPGAQFFLKFDESPSSNKTIFVDDSNSDGYLTYESRYISYQDLAAFNVTSDTGSEGIKIVGVSPVSPATVSFRVIEASENQSWETYEGIKFWFVIEINPSATANLDNSHDSASQKSSNTAATTVSADSTTAITPSITTIA